MPNVTEPEVVTLAKMHDHLAARTVEVQRSLAEVEAEIARTALEAERGANDNVLRRLAAAEKRRDKLAADLERLKVAELELERQLAAEREAAEAQATRDLLCEYIADRDAVQQANRAMFAAVESMATLARTANERGRKAAQLARRLGFSDERGPSAIGPQYGYIRSAFEGVMHATPRLVNDAREAMRRDWRDTPNGRRATALEAALGDGKAKAE